MVAGAGIGRAVRTGLRCRRLCRPKPSKLVTCARLRAVVEAKLELRIGRRSRSRVGWWRPSLRIRRCMCRTRRSIFSLYVQSRGALRKELTCYLRHGHSSRRPHGLFGDQWAGPAGRRRSTFGNGLPKLNDRAVPGHWEGDLLMGKRMHAIATLVERKTRFVMLVALPNGHAADVVADALAAKIVELPEQLRRSLTWDQGKEMAAHARFSVTTGVPVYFCDPRSPWQRGSNENINGLLRSTSQADRDRALQPS